MAAAARDLRPRVAPRKPLPRLLFLTDPVRTPDPVAVAERLTPEVAVVFRSFGAADAVRTGLRLAAVARANDLILLAGADASLAQAIGAHGVHLPERLTQHLPHLRAAHPDWILTTAAHGAVGESPADAVLVSPVFPSNSPSAGVALGVESFTRIVEGATVPVYALGGVTAATAPLLADTGAAGFAGIEAFL